VISHSSTDNLPNGVTRDNLPRARTRAHARTLQRPFLERRTNQRAAVVSK
jgi:hypothetical protein